jgi:hypothetical protein
VRVMDSGEQGRVEWRPADDDEVARQRRREFRELPDEAKVRSLEDHLRLIIDGRGART